MYEEAGIAVAVLIGALLVLAHFVLHGTWVISHLFAAPSVLLVSGTNAEGQKLQMLDFQEAFAFLKNATEPTARVLAWWEYGDAIAVLGERATVIDAQSSACSEAGAGDAGASAASSTWHGCLSQVSQTLLAPVDVAADRMQAMGADYVLVKFGGLTGDTNDDLSKLPSLLRLAQCRSGATIERDAPGGGAAPGAGGVLEGAVDDYLPHGRLGVGDSTAGAALKSSLLYQLSFQGFAEVQSEYGRPKGYDRARGEKMCGAEVPLVHARLEEAFTSSHWLVRVFRLRPPLEQQ